MSHRMPRRHLRLQSLLALTVLAAVLGLSLAACDPETPAPAATPAAYAGPRVRAPENFVFAYQSVAELQAAGLDVLGRPRAIVFDWNAPNADEPALARARGSQAYKYMQFTWFNVASPDWLNTAPSQRGSWALCNNGVTVTNLNDGSTNYKNGTWNYADLNERSLVDAVLAYTANIKALGYDGVFLDVAGRALRSSITSVVSSCTERPLSPGSPYGNAYMNVVDRIRAQGLKVGMTYPPVTADPLARPDPQRPGAFLADMHTRVDWVLHENAGHPREGWALNDPSIQLMPSFDDWAQQNANSGLYAPGKVVAMSKPRIPLNGPPEQLAQRRQQERYGFALTKLSGGPVAVNTGIDFCDYNGLECNRTGYAPRLTNLVLGNPLDNVPVSTACVNNSCVWYRRFAKGLVVVAKYGTAARQVTIPLMRDGSCRYVAQVDGGAVSRGTCLSSLTLTIGNSGAYGRIYTYSLTAPAAR